MSVLYTKAYPVFLAIFMRVKASPLINLTLLSDLIYYSSQLWCLCSGHSGLNYYFLWTYEVCSCLGTLYLIVFTLYLHRQSLHRFQVLLSEASLGHSITQWNLPILSSAHLMWFILLYIYFFQDINHLPYYLICFIVFTCLLSPHAKK